MLLWSLVQVRYSWTSMNYGIKWYGCVNYKKIGDCDFFQWAYNEMSPYKKKKKKVTKRLKETCNDIARLEKLVETEQAKYHANFKKLLETEQAKYHANLEANLENQSV